MFTYNYYHNLLSFFLLNYVLRQLEYKLMNSNLN